MHSMFFFIINSIYSLNVYELFHCKYALSCWVIMWPDIYYNEWFYVEILFQVFSSLFVEGKKKLQVFVWSHWKSGAWTVNWYNCLLKIKFAIFLYDSNLVIVIVKYTYLLESGQQIICLSSTGSKSG